MSKCVIYVIRNAVNGRCYVGSTGNMAKRKQIHIYYLNRRSHPSYRLQDDWDLHGSEAFFFEEVSECSSEGRYQAEQALIDSLKSYIPENGYNISPTAKDNSGSRRRNITREKISEAHKGKKKTAEHRAKIADKNRERAKLGVSEETRKKISASLKGRVFSQSTKKKMLESRRSNGRPWHTDESKEKIRQAAIGRELSEETRIKISEAGKGRKWTDEQRKKMQDYERRPVSAEARNAISKARGGKSFIITSKDGTEYFYSLLSEAAEKHGLDCSNIHKCLKGKAKQTKGYVCRYC